MTTASLLVGTALFIAVGLAVVPMHVTYGAGSAATAYAYEHGLT